MGHAESYHLLSRYLLRNTRDAVCASAVQPENSPHGLRGACKQLVSACVQVSDAAARAALFMHGYT